MTKRTLIPAQFAEVFWNDDKNVDHRAGGAEVVVTDIRVRHEQVERTGKDPTEHYFCSAGAHTDGWMTDMHPQARPEGLFAANWLARRASSDAVKAALHEFGKIEECEWARRMHETIDRIDRYNRGEADSD